MPNDGTIGTDLQRCRLEHRARRIELVIDALRHRMVYRRRSDGGVPEPLRQAIRGFDAELRQVRHELQALSA